MDIQGKMFRRLGQWVIEIETEQWVLDDILYDLSRTNMPVEISIAQDTTVTGGATRWIGGEPVYVSEGTVEIHSSAVFREPKEAGE